MITNFERWKKICVRDFYFHVLFDFISKSNKFDITILKTQILKLELDTNLIHCLTRMK